MYICICNAVTDHEIEQAVREGARTLDHLEDRLGVTGNCGKCRDKTAECLARYLPVRPELVRSA